MPAQCAIPARPLTIEDLPELIPACLVALAPLPQFLGGRLPRLPEQIPGGLPLRAAREVADALAGDVPGRRDRRQAPIGGHRDRAADMNAGMTIDTAECARLLGILAAVGDRRDPRGIRYPLPYLLALPIVAMAAFEVDMTGIGEWIAAAPDEVLLALGAPTGTGARPRRPDAKTVADALALHADDYDQALCAWTGARRREQHRHDHEGHEGRGRLRACVHIDGKASKGAAPRGGGPAPMHLAARRDDGTVAAQLPVEVAKTNEITVFAPLLDLLPHTDLAGAVVTADQLHTQRGHARYLHDRDAFYVFTVGENQPRLFAALDALPWRQIAIENATVDRGHGRIEIRTIQVLPVTQQIADLFPHAAQAFLIERHVYDLNGADLGHVAVLGVTSLPPGDADGGALLAYVRGHWSVESLHWLRDRVFSEDDSRDRRTVRALTALRNLVISMIRLAGITQISRWLRASRRDPYRSPLLLLGLARRIATVPHPYRDQTPESTTRSIPRPQHQPGEITLRHRL